MGIELFQYEFMQRAFLAGLMIAVCAPLVGIFLVTRRLSLIADTLSHVSLSGVALGFILGIEPIIPTLIITSTVAIIIEVLRSNDKLPGDSILAMFLPGGLAVSLVLLSFGKGLNGNLFAYLFGSVTTVQTTDLVLISLLTILTVTLIAGFYKKLLFSSYDEDGARLAGIKVVGINLLLLLLTAVVVSVTMRIVGVLLVGAMMIIPVMTAARIAKSFKETLFVSVGVALVSVVLGLLAAYFLNLPAGAAIVIVLLGLFGLTQVFRV